MAKLLSSEGLSKISSACYSGNGSLLFLLCCVFAMGSMVMALCAFSSRSLRNERASHSMPISLTRENFHRREAVGEGDSSIWKKRILIGNRCKPLEFSGAIIYDSDGNRLPKFPPKSPRRLFPVP
ncbi:hypothetical protein AMTRI_Chr13g84810 [Amborella trichopoda]